MYELLCCFWVVDRWAGSRANLSWLDLFDLAWSLIFHSSMKMKTPLYNLYNLFLGQSLLSDQLGYNKCKCAHRNACLFLATSYLFFLPEMVLYLSNFLLLELVSWKFLNPFACIFGLFVFFPSKAIYHIPMRLILNASRWLLPRRSSACIDQGPEANKPLIHWDEKWWCTLQMNLGRGRRAQFGS